MADGGHFLQVINATALVAALSLIHRASSNVCVYVDNDQSAISAYKMAAEGHLVKIKEKT